MFSMTKQARETFLADVHVGVISIPYASVEGPIVAIERSDRERDLRPLARRYFGVEGGDDYVARMRAEHGDNVLVRMRPERWLTADYGTRVASAETHT